MIFYIHTDTKWTLSRVLTKTNQTIVTKLIWLPKSERASDQLDVNLLRRCGYCCSDIRLSRDEFNTPYPLGQARVEGYVYWLD